MLTLRYCQSLDELNNSQWEELAEKVLGSKVHPGRKETFFFAREALRLALCELDYDPAISELVLTTYDLLPSYPELTVSLSHTPGLGVAAAGLRKHFRSLGVDVEKEDRIVKADILQKVAHPQDANLRNIEMWLMKEAAFKCLSNSHKLSSRPLFTDIRIGNKEWEHSPSGIKGEWELRRVAPYLIGIATLKN